MSDTEVGNDWCEGEGIGVRKKRGFRARASNPATRSFWMMPKLSSIVIINLIANLSFLYHKPEKTAVTRID